MLATIAQGLDTARGTYRFIEEEALHLSYFCSYGRKNRRDIREVKN